MTWSPDSGSSLEAGAGRWLAASIGTGLLQQTSSKAAHRGEYRARRERRFHNPARLDQGDGTGKGGGRTWKINDHFLTGTFIDDETQLRLVIKAHLDDA